MTKPPAPAATYLYCAVQSSRRPRAGQAPKGLAGLGIPRALDAGRGLWLIVADAPLDRYGEGPIDRALGDLGWVSRCAVGHEAVVEHFTRAGTVVPMKLFTIFGTDERAVAHVARTRRRIDRLLARVSGREEWGVRLILDERRARRRRVASPRGNGAGSGTGFLLQKKAERDAARHLAAAAAREADRIYDDLAVRADEARRRTPEPSGTPVRIVLEAAFLVPAKQGRQFRSAVAAMARPMATAGYDLTLTGPWPPYTFVTDPT